VHKLPYWRLSGYYFFYFAFVGAMSPYWGLYLKSLAFDAWQIGVLMSLLQVMRIFAPNIWGWLADHTGRRSAIVQIAATGSLLCFLGVFWGSGFVWLFAVMAGMSFFWSASLPLVEATTLSHLGERTHHYGRIRLWGSVGFIAAVLGLGYWLNFRPVADLRWVVLTLMAGIALLARWIPDAKSSLPGSAHVAIWQVVRRPEVLSFLVACFLMAVAHGPYYAFYSIYLVEHGYSKSAVGWLWALGVICEIAVFLWLPRWMPNVSMVKVLLAALAIAVARFLMIAWGVDYLGWLILAQTLHAATFGAYHVAALALIHRYFHGRNQVRGQGIYNGLTYGAGGTAGGLYAGAIWDGWGAHWVFMIAAGCALLAFMLVLWQQHRMSQVTY
jgi:MFS transporter, PPP family, 3-phenylpropionic acid transporter